LATGHAVELGVKADHIIFSIALCPLVLISAIKSFTGVLSS